jgi:hypothetical protein
MSVSERDLLRTGIGRMDVMNVLCEANGSLNCAGAAVPRQGTSRRNGSEISLKFIRVLRAVLRILLRLPGNMVFKIKGFVLT